MPCNEAMDPIYAEERKRGPQKGTDDDEDGQTQDPSKRGISNEDLFMFFLSPLPATPSVSTYFTSRPMPAG
jgi:hypothetical protein